MAVKTAVRLYSELKILSLAAYRGIFCQPFTFKSITIILRSIELINYWSKSMQATIPTETNYDRAEAFLDACTMEELQATADMMGLSTQHIKPCIVSVAKDKSRLCSDVIRYEEDAIAKRRNELYFIMTDMGKAIYFSMSMVELRAHIKYSTPEVSLYYKTYRDRTVDKTRQNLIEELLYETDYPTFF